MKYHIIGAGLAGCECALSLAKAGIEVYLYEQKPEQFSPAHISPLFAELVCSNSFRSDDSMASGVGLLKEEMRLLESPLLEIAETVKVPAGKALAVDRELFAQAVTKAIKENPYIKVIHKEIKSIKEFQLSDEEKLIIAAGPLASSSLIESLKQYIDTSKLYFYDAIAPIITAESVDMEFAFYGSRYGHEKEEHEKQDEGDYLNCPMNKEEYHLFWEALVSGERVPSHNFEKEIHFEGCMPIEALADRGEKTLCFGSLKPVGFIDPKTGHRPWALLQLRKENKEGNSYNLVGCQTKLTYKEQDRIFRFIPALKNVEFLRYGSVHRNTYVNAPHILNPDLSLKEESNIYLIGQITGVEGYVESIASGLWLSLQLKAKAENKILTQAPKESALGGLLNHLQEEVKNFQPSNAHFGLMPELGGRVKKKERKPLLAQRGQKAFQEWLEEISKIYTSPSEEEIEKIDL